MQYPDHNQPFHVYADASDYQLGSVIMQNNKPVAYFSRKLNSAQRNYTVGEKEILSIVETLKEFRTMLYGCRDLHVYTDHKNNTFEKFSTQRVLRWRLLLDEFGPTFHHIPGDDNPLADALSRLGISERQSTEAEIVNSNSSHSKIPTQLDSFHSMVLDDDKLLDCFVHLPQQAGVPFQMDYAMIVLNQQNDADLQDHAARSPDRVAQIQLAPNTSVYCYIPEPNAPWKVYLPRQLLNNVVRWYHLSLGHIGTSRLYDTLRMHFFPPRRKQACEREVQRCDSCQRYKNVGRGHGDLTSREVTLLPWRDVAVDLIGPWTLRIQQREVVFQALTIIDTVTNLVEVVRIDNKTAVHVSLHFANTWLSRYPRPLNCTYDQGGEFIGWEFQEMLIRNGIHPRPTSAKNPQSNSICERMHQSVGNTLRVLANSNPPAGIVDANQLVDTAIATAVYATRCSYNSSLQTTPGGLAFGRDMFLNIPLQTDLQLLQQHRQQLVDQRLIAANRKRFSYDYQIGQEVLKLVYKPNKLGTRAEGPYRVEQVHANGTLTIRLTPTTVERISLRRVKPYYR